MPLDQVMTVKGPLAPSQLGITLMHEHILIDMMREVRHGGLLNDVDTALEELCGFQGNGGRTIVDVTSRGLGGNPAALRRISQRTGLNIIAATGYYREPYFDRDFIDRTSSNALADLFTRDIEVGIDDTDVRAGIIGEIGCDRWLTAQEERVFRAAARAHARTGVSITTHAARWPIGNAQLDLLSAEEVDPSRVIVGHSDFVASADWQDEADVLDYHAQLAHRGAFVEFDTIRRGPEYQLQRRVRYVQSLIDLGYISNILLSHDVCVQAHLTLNGGGGYTFILKDFAQLLRDTGVTDSQLHTILVDNPKRALTGDVATRSAGSGQ